MGLVAWLYEAMSRCCMSSQRAMPAGDRGGDYPADGDQDARGGCELMAVSFRRVRQGVDSRSQNPERPVHKFRPIALAIGSNCILLR